MQQEREVATLAGGCFWCLEAVYELLKGVEKVQSGYSGGKIVNPTYEQVCSGRTGHAEVVQVTFDPKQHSYSDLLKVFFSIHDPTTLNSQGPDHGTQYRSAIYYHSAAQKEIAERTVVEINKAKLWPHPTVTEVTQFSAFYPAETYHGEYFRNNPEQGYCQVIIAPKVAKFRKAYLEKLKR
ncbi:MAG: peptide-methionine (S)-S-oxide reductase [Dehalococcoidia bacterium]|nr:peptide-methionine (S)-S-oxide reductase [Dehalococcoidia bacterium]